MSELSHPTVQKLHDAFDGNWKALPPEQKEAIKEAVRIIASQDDQLNDQLSHSMQGPPRFAESRFVMFTSERGQLMLPVSEGSTACILWELTARGDTPEEILAHVITAQKVAISYGFIPKDVYFDQRRQEREGQPQAGPVHSSSPSSPSSQPATNGQTFVAQSIQAAPMSEKKPDLIWKIMGNKSKFPVAIYEAIEEVKPLLAEEGVDLSAFTTHDGKLRQYQLSGWIAHYEANDKGYPSKVTKLVKG